MATLVNAGRDIITNRIKGSGTEPNFVAWGTGTTAETASQTALATASSEARTTGTSTRQTTSVTNDTYQVIGTITSTQTQTIAEMGLFDASSSGNMLIRAVFTGIPVVNLDSIQFTVKLQFT